ncbi:MAG: hypothetical protein R2827_08185 [Bdellovibrionales bacterium]
MAGLDPDGRYYLSELIAETAQQGTSIFFSSHLLHDTQRLCQNLVILQNGLVKFEGPTQDMLKQVGHTSVIKYTENGELRTIELKDGEAVQKKIDELRGAKKNIVSITPHVTSLEEAFVSFALKKRDVL